MPLNTACNIFSRRAKDISYGQGERQKLDIFASKKTDSPRPVIVFFHGGSWQFGDKKYYSFVGSYIKSIGAVCVIVNYPLFPKQTFPGFIEDASLALAWVKDNIGEYGGDAQKIFLMGHSSGGHTALITALKYQRYVKGCISVATPNNISRRVYGEIFGQAFENGGEQPTRYIKQSSNGTRFLIIHGSWDKVVPVADGADINTSLIESGYKSDLVKPRMGHMRIMTTIGWPLAPIYKEGKIIKKFIGN